MMTDNLLFTIRQISCPQFDTQRKSTLNHTEIVCGRRNVLCCGWFGKFFLSYVPIIGVCWCVFSTISLYQCVSSPFAIHRSSARTKLTAQIFVSKASKRERRFSWNLTIVYLHCAEQNAEVTITNRAHENATKRTFSKRCDGYAVVVGNTFNFECLLNTPSMLRRMNVRCRARFMWITMSCKNWMTVAAGNGLNK